jgi:hypothetical protein
MQIYTPEERMHMQHALQMKRDRAIFRALNGQRPADRKRFGKEIETDIIDRLRAAGHYVSRAGANDHFDLLVDGLRIEVKAAALSGGRYQAALRSNDADILVFVCRAPSPIGEGRRCRAFSPARGEFLDHFFVMPFDRVAGLTHIEIRNARPDRYAGWMAAWRDAWHTIDRLVEIGVNHYQPHML